MNIILIAAMLAAAVLLSQIIIELCMAKRFLRGGDIFLLKEKIESKGFLSNDKKIINWWFYDYATKDNALLYKWRISKHGVILRWNKKLNKLMDEHYNELLKIDELQPK